MTWASRQRGSTRRKACISQGAVVAVPARVGRYARVSRRMVSLLLWAMASGIASGSWAAAAGMQAPGAMRAADGAMSSGDAAPPSPAIVVGPDTARPAPLAEPVPAADAARRRFGMLPTTAEPGTLVPGGRRQALTFADLGARDPLQLRGTDGQNGIAFSVRRDEVVMGATLHLVYSYSPALLPDLSQLKVLINGEVAATLPLPAAQAGMTVARDVSIDPRFVTEYNHLNVQLIGHYTKDCEDPANSSLWATVSNASRLELTYAALPERPELGVLPAPFFDSRDVRRLELPFAFAARAPRETLEAAGIVASWFGALASYRGARFPARPGGLPESGNAVVFATADDRLDGVTLPAIDGPTLAVVERQAPAHGQLLLVLGRTPDEVKVAALTLVLGSKTLAGTHATVSRLENVAPRVPYDAPNWLSSTHPVRLGELAEGRALSVSGYDAGAVRIDLRVAPDLFTWDTRGAPIDLRYRYTPTLRADRSSLNLSVGDTFVKALPIPARETSRWSLSRYLPFVANGIDRATLHVPPLLLTPRTPLQLHFFYEIPDMGRCTGRLLQNVAGSIDPDSTIDVSSFPHYKALPDLAAFANSGFPFTRMADLSDTAVVLPAEPGADVYGLYLLAMGRMGVSTGYPVSGVTVTDAAGVGAFASKDLLILGAPDTQPLLTRWAARMPFGTDRDSGLFGGRFGGLFGGAEAAPSPGAERERVRAGLSIVSDGTRALIAGFESPLRKTRSAVALISASGQADEALGRALLDDDMLTSVQGAMVVIRDRTVTVTSNETSYHVGALPPLTYLRWFLSGRPLLLALFSVLAAFVAAALFYRLLRARAARRLKE
ncbi:MULTISPECIES: cellulose biosynthesis cyclic di-GMP-binding regulatory protein BcsB [unclassified Burkholderia]|uniref:cellulose biosynthesis cyclic di-GMP-binding regulatory protein BcsB n=1 Tax=unclassified Burkholderia TaxID=2613784 RepID=UPI000F59981F|nr:MULTISPECIES: cellulose biosynthesis cyclic di-GMP-binding regulatory protein BcsB [unclassified Burkholderia]RQR28815.1 cellulose biosynthesis cyclic di-GMP-binding regulatory protein BcsB [Burkholderia sp. Bp9131]RQR60544.1 cellulose biosynthesis cyclic di-GMP-binding regulatory protein BcsB [Burkholderia sp. Bp9015]RQR93493.1 cellulose biosynthesis cyclic di-GMP-binding regulatory protein BcsB [Burkholderia sp. Bp8991]